jgi:hypothetical protein
VFVSFSPNMQHLLYKQTSTLFNKADGFFFRREVETNLSTDRRVEMFCVCMFYEKMDVSL